MLPGDGARLAGALAGLGSPEGVREVVGQRLARLSTATTALLELAAVAGPRVRPRGRRARRACRTPSSPRALEQAVAHGMIEEVPARPLAYRFTPRARAPRALRPHGRAAARRAAPARRRGARARHGAGDSRGRLPSSPTTSRRRRPSTARGARGRLLAAGRVGAALRDARLRRGRRALLAPRSSSASTTRAGAARRSSSSARRASRAGRVGRRHGGLPRRRARSPASSATPNMLATAAVGFEEACWRPGHHRRRAPSSCSRRRRARSARRTRSCA